MNEQLSRMPVRIDAGGVCIQGHDWGGMNVAHIRFPAGAPSTKMPLSFERLASLWARRGEDAASRVAS